MTKEIVMLIIGVLLAEGTEAAPWLAKKLVRWSAYARHLDRHRAEIRAEELEAVIDTRPGKLLKLTSALLFAVGASITLTRRNILLLRLLRTVEGGHQASPPATSHSPSIRVPNDFQRVLARDLIMLDELDTETRREAERQLIQFRKFIQMMTKTGSTDKTSLEIELMSFRQG
jgi:hypothetical protein